MMAAIAGKSASYSTFSNRIWELAEQHKLSSGAINVYMRIKSMAYGTKVSAFPSQLHLAKALRCSVRSVQRYLVELVGAGVIESLQRYSTSNIYTLVDLDAPDRSVASDRTGVSYKELRSLRKYTSVYVRGTEDSDSTLKFIKVLGDNGIDPDTPRGAQYLKIAYQEGASAEQLNHAIQIVNSKLANNTIKKNEFGLAVISIRQSKAGFVLCATGKPSKVQKGVVKPLKSSKYDNFYL